MNEHPRPIHVLHCITSLLPDGAQQMLLKLCRFGNRQRCRHTVVALGKEKALLKEFQQLGITVEILEMKRSTPSLSSLRRLSRIITAVQPDILQGWLYHANIAVSAGTWLAHWKGPVFWNIRRSLYSLRQDRLVTRAIIRFSAALSHSPFQIIYNGTFMAEQHERYGFSPAKRLVIPNGFDTEIFCPDNDARHRLRKLLGVASDALIVGTVGRFHPHKDQHTFVRAAGLVGRQHNKVQFAAIGRGINESNFLLRRWIEEEDLVQRFHLLSERDDVLKLLPGFDVFCSPSLSEGFPNAIGEAMACGIPCVVTDAGASAEIVGDTGIVVPRQQPGRLAHALKLMLEASDDERRALGFRARNRIIERFPIHEVVNLYETVYERAIFPHSNQLRQAPQPPLAPAVDSGI
ncbi:MAG TPA: glycosyltransferase [Oligoflexia bacterium]|nr:glycosyltransferase [Oligoflexia bacterium]